MNNAQKILTRTLANTRRFSSAVEKDDGVMPSVLVGRVAFISMAALGIFSIGKFSVTGGHGAKAKHGLLFL
jgi:hypothetical protein